MPRRPLARRAPYAGEVTCPPARRARLGRDVLAVVLGVLLALTTGAVAGSAAAERHASPARALADDVAPAPSGLPAADDGAPSTVVVLGTAGVRWADVDPEATPALWQLTESGAVGSLVTRSVRTVSCPADGWLALSAGNRAGDTVPDPHCRELAEPADDGVVPRWDAYIAERDRDTYGSRLGLLGDLLVEHGLDSLGIGPGAAVALAGSDGVVVGEHLKQPDDAAALSEVVGAALGATDVVVVDLGAVPDAPQGTAREPHLAAVEARAAAVVDALDGSASEPTVILASLADGGTAPRLQVLAVRGTPGVGTEAGGEVLRSASTRQDGYVLATDVLPTLLGALGLEGAAPTGALVGSAVTGTPAGDGRLAAMVDLDRHSAAVRALTPGFFGVLIALNLALYAAVWLRPGRGFRTAGVVVGALPVATFLANLVPWWRADGAGLYLAVAVAAAIVAAGALLGPWRRSPLGPLTAVASVTAVTIIADVLTGSRLQLGSPLGVHPLVAGRFYGLNNSAFALLLVSSLLVAAVAGSALVARGRRAAAVGIVAMIGVVVTVVDGMPGLGSDFGGPPALVPAFAVLALRVAGVRVGWRRLALVVGGGVVVVSAFAIADWLRPEGSRTHLGRFVQTVLDGGLWDVVARKLAQNLAILTGSWLVLLVGGGLALGVWLLGRGARADGAPGGRGLLATVTDVPALRLALPAVVTGLVIGFAVNDSGIVIPAVGMSLGVPLVIATLAARRGPTARREVSGERSAPRPA